jgi:phasin family protein
MAEILSKSARRRPAVKPPFAAPAAEPVSASTDHLPMVEAVLPTAAVPADPEPKDETMATDFQQTTDTVNDQAQAATQEFAGRAQGAMDKGTQMVSEMTAFAKGNVEAVVESTGIYARGLESFGQDAAAFAKKSYEEATAAMKAMAAAKSPTELMKLQSDYTRAAFDAMVAETSKSTEKMVKLVGEAVQPISNRVSLAADKAKLAA